MFNKIRRQLVAAYCHIILRDEIFYGEFVFNLYLLSVRADEIEKFYRRKHNAASEALLKDVKTISVNVGKILLAIYTEDIDPYITKLYKLSYSNRFSKVTDECIYSNELDSLNLPDSYIKETPIESDNPDTELTYIPFFNHLHMLHYKEMIIKHYMVFVNEYGLLDEFKQIFEVIDRVFKMLWEDINKEFIKDILEERGEIKMAKKIIERPIHEDIIKLVDKATSVDYIIEYYSDENTYEQFKQRVLSMAVTVYNIYIEQNFYGHDSTMDVVNSHIEKILDLLSNEIVTQNKINEMLTSINLIDHYIGDGLSYIIRKNKLPKEVIVKYMEITHETLEEILEESKLRDKYEGSYTLTGPQYRRYVGLCNKFHN